MIEFIRKHSYFVFVPLGLLIAALIALTAIGIGSEGDVALIYQIF